jgi:hypothetical protein
VEGAAVVTGIGVIGRTGGGASPTYGAGVRSTTRATVVFTGRQADVRSSATAAPDSTHATLRMGPGGSILRASLMAAPRPSRAR